MQARGVRSGAVDDRRKTWTSANSTAGSTWGRAVAVATGRDRVGIAALCAAITLLHVIGFGSLLLIVAPHHYRVGAQIMGIGLGITAYTFGLRHAFDADHIAAIDNTTRKLMADGKKPKSVGFWFAIGHHVIVCALCSCYPRPILGNSPEWYRTPNYRRRLGALAP